MTALREPPIRPEYVLPLRPVAEIVPHPIDLHEPWLLHHHQGVLPFDETVDELELKVDVDPG